MRLRNAFLAIAVAAIALAALPASALEFHGYLRTGIGGNFRGGGQACFALPGADYKWRLGNECETYAELQFNETLYRDKSGASFNYVGMLSYQTGQRQDYESLNGDWPNAWANRQNYVSADNLPFLGGASLWIGKRYYMRESLYSVDWFYFDPSGPGAGIENVDVGGLFRGALAVFTNKVGAETYYPVDGAHTNQVTSQQFWRVDLRGYNIPFFVGELTLALQLGILSASGNYPTGQEVSPAVNFQWKWPVLGGRNLLTFQWGQGPMASLNAYPSPSTSSSAWQWRILEDLLFEPIPQLSGQLVFIYQDQNRVYENPNPNPGNGSGVDWAGNSSTSWTLGVRPVWNVTNYFKLQADVAYQSVTPKVAYASGSPFTSTDTMGMFKTSIAPTFAPLPGPGGSFWTRPELRLFVTWASWNKAAQAQGAMAQGSCAATGTSGSVFGCSTNGFTFGAQVEAWW